MRTPRHLLLALSLLVLPLAAGCIAAAWAGAGALVATEYLSDTPHVAHLQVDVDQVWPATVQNLNDMGATEVEVQNYPRVIQAKLYDGEVYVKVEAFDIDHTVIRLQFRRNRLIDNTTAESVLEELLKRYDFASA
jgi:hypothetical protein